MIYTQFFQAIKTKNLACVNILYGKEIYARDEAVRKVRAALLPEGLEALNETVFDAAVSVSELIDAAETLPFMADRRLIVVKNWAPLNSKKSKSSGENQSGADKKADDENGGSAETASSGDGEDIKRFTEWLDTVPHTCCLLFVQNDAPVFRSKKLEQAFKARAESVEFTLLSEADLFKWCSARLKESGCSIEPNAMSELTFRAGTALTGLRQELDKLRDYVGDRAVITAADVEAVVTPSTECTIFQMIDNLMAKRNDRAQMLLKSLLEGGENALGAIAMLTRQMRMLTHIRLLRADGMPLDSIIQKLGLNSYSARKAAQQAGSFSAESLEAGYKACVDTEYAIKNGRMSDTVALDALMLRLSEMK